MKFVLASKSPRRRDLFSIISENFVAVEADVDEHAFAMLPAKEQVLRLAEEKCRTAAPDFPGDVVVGCDTLVELFGNIFGKPKDAADAARMLLALSGNTHNVHTGIFALSPDDVISLHCVTKVTFNKMSAEEIEEYIATKDPFDKAGSYGIQGMASRYIKGIEGDYFNVLGLPVSALYRTFRNRGIV